MMLQLIVASVYACIWSPQSQGWRDTSLLPIPSGKPIKLGEKGGRGVAGGRMQGFHLAHPCPHREIDKLATACHVTRGLSTQGELSMQNWARSPIAI